MNRITNRRLRGKVPLALRGALAFVLALALIAGTGLGANTVLAQEEGMLTSAVDEGESILTSNWQLLGAGESDTYRFDYAGNNQPILVRMEIWPVEGAQFQVWTEDTLAQADSADVSPIGTGTFPENVTNVLSWQGSAEEAQTFVVVVSSTAGQTFPYNLEIGGPGLAGEAAPVDAMVTGLPDTIVNVREGPSTDFAVATTVPSGTPITVLGQDETGNWLRVQIDDGTEGWMARFLTDFTATASTVEMPPLAPPASAAAQTTADTATIVVTIPGARVNVRTGPSTAYDVIRSVPADTTATVLGQNTAGDWLQVRLSDGTTGWVARFLTDYTATATAVDTPPLAPPATVSVETAFDTAIIDTTPAGANVNVRMGPSTANDILRTVPDGTAVTVTGQDTSGTWLQVVLDDGTVGWVARFLTDFAGTADSVSDAETASTTTTTAQVTMQAETGVAPLPGQAGPLVDPPVEAELLADRWRLLQEGDVHWYSFQHPGDESPIQIWMVADPSFGAGFGVYGEENAQSIMAGTNPEDIAAIGRGTSNPDEPGTLFWRGTFEEAGRFFVRVRHGTTGVVRYDIFGSGPGFSSP